MRSGRVLAYPSPVPGLSEIVFLLLFLTFLVPAIQRRMPLAPLDHPRAEQKRGSRVITLIHRQESVSLLGIPLRRFIDIEDSEQVLRAVRLTPDTVLIDWSCTAWAGSCWRRSRSPARCTAIRRR